MTDEQSASKDGMSRRDFVKRSTVATAALSTGVLASGNFAYAGGTDTLRIGLVGCGGRGTGAAHDCVRSSEGVELVAMADLFEDRMEESKEQLQERLTEDQYKVTPERTFLGFDAYKRVLDTNIDIVLLATPPAFRPLHLRAAVEKDTNVFMEKPVATDTVGIRSVIESSKRAEEKGLAIVAGTQRRHDPAYVEAMKRIHDGAIGDIKSGQVYWNQGGLWHHEREPGMSDMEWQLRNWLYFTWLSGDHIVEQHVHNIDVANWALQAHPEKAIGVGGRQVRTDPSYGHIFDHFGIEFVYPNGARVFSMARQQEGTPARVEEHFMGTKGTTDAHSTIDGETTWTYEGEDVNPYVQEHADLVESIRSGEPLNEGQRVAESVLTAIMGREAAYTGQELTWDDVVNAELDLVPNSFEYGSLPFPEVAAPGQTELNRRGAVKPEKKIEETAEETEAS